MILKFLRSLILTDSRLQRETLLFLCSQEHIFFFNYSRLPITRTIKENRKNFELAVVRVIGSTKQITGKEEMGWGMNASNVNTSKLDKYTVLDTVFNLD